MRGAAARLAGVASLVAAAAVAAGAFGAHALAGRLDRRGMELWSTADRYLGLAAVAALAMAAFARHEDAGGEPKAGTLLLAGGAVFALSLCGLALGGPRWLGAITPVGGVAMIAGFTWFGLVVLRRARE